MYCFISNVGSKGCFAVEVVCQVLAQTWRKNLEETG